MMSLRENTYFHSSKLEAIEVLIDFGHLFALLKLWDLEFQLNDIFQMVQMKVALNSDLFKNDAIYFRAKNK